MITRFRVRLESSDEGVAVWVPALPGCCSQGKDEKEALENIEDAIREYLAVREALDNGTDIRELELAV